MPVNKVGTSRPQRYQTVLWASGELAVNILDFIAYAKSTQVPIIISPLHDKDIYDEVDVLKQKKLVKSGEKPEVNAVLGQQKPPHWHVQVDFGGYKTLWQARQFFNFENWGQDMYLPYVEPILRWSGAVRYDLHLDNPEKAQYSPADMLVLNGANASAITDMNDLQRIETTKELFAFVKRERYTEFADLVEYAMESGDDSLFRMLYEKPSYYDAYMRSVARKREKAALARARIEGMNSLGATQNLVNTYLEMRTQSK